MSAYQHVRSWFRVCFLQAEALGATVEYCATVTLPLALFVESVAAAVQIAGGPCLNVSMFGHQWKSQLQNGTLDVEVLTPLLQTICAELQTLVYDRLQMNCVTEISSEDVRRAITRVQCTP